MLGGVPQSPLSVQCLVGITCEELPQCHGTQEEMEASWLYQSQAMKTHPRQQPLNCYNRHKNQGTKYILHVSSLQGDSKTL